MTVSIVFHSGCVLGILYGRGKRLALFHGLIKRAPGPGVGVCLVGIVGDEIMPGIDFGRVGSNDVHSVDS